MSPKPNNEWEKRFDKICEFTDAGVYVSYDKAVDFIRSERQRLAKAIKSKKINGVHFLDTQVAALLKLLEE